MLFIVILIVGAGGIIAQTVLLRELLVSFLGNELTLGVILASWMLWEAAGALLIAAALRKLKDKASVMIWLLVLFAVSLCLSAAASRLFKPVFDILPGEAIGTAMICLSSFALTAVPAFCHGGLFSAACAYSRPWQAYVLETAGTLAAGIVLTFWLIPAFSHFQIVRAASLISVAACIPLAAMVPGPWRKAVLYSVPLFCFLFLLMLDPAQIEQYTLARQYRQGKVIDQRNSWYGNIVVTQRQGQKTFFYNGVPVVTTPVPDVIWNQDFAHFPLVFCQDPAEVLVVESGLGGTVGEILKVQPVDRVDYCQQDSLLAAMLRKYPSRLIDQELSDRRLNVIHDDARSFLRNAVGAYDVIYIGSSAPGDLASNRFFTDEFFRLAADRLRSNGVLALSLPGSLAYISPELRDMNFVILNALSRHFSRVRIIPGDLNIVLASHSADFNVKPEILYRRLVKRGVRASNLNPAYFKRRLAGQWIDWFRLETAGATQSINSDDRPIAVYHTLILWNKKFSGRAMALLQRMSGLRLWVVLACVALSGIIAAAVVLFRRRRRVRTGVLYAMLTTGFFGMSMTLALVFRVQVQYGYVYQLIGILTALFMSGAAAGSVAAGYFIRRAKDPLNALAVNEVACVAFVLAVFFAVMRGSSVNVSSAVYCVLFVISGFFVGVEFPLAAHLYRAGRTGRPGDPGVVFSADLAGGVCASVLSGVFFLPLLGLAGTLAVLAALKAVSAALILLIKNMK
ncbi:MAG TPA: hypothetical protein PLJ26_05855 [Candidatus Omnitrophota bacterium]|nr:hypothetical protein [Candidatus Omnitrophota bacterium]